MSHTPSFKAELRVVRGLSCERKRQTSKRSDKLPAHLKLNALKSRILEQARPREKATKCLQEEVKGSEEKGKAKELRKRKKDGSKEGFPEGGR